jgi:hypothetical protein
MESFCEGRDEDSPAVIGENLPKLLLLFRRMHYYMRVSTLVLLLTNVSVYMGQSRYSEANGRLTDLDMFCLSWNLKVHYCAHKNTQHDLYHATAITETLVLLSLLSASRFYYAVS